MASYTSWVEPDSGITCISIIGEIKIQEIQDFMQSPEFANRSNAVLFDCRKATFAMIPSDEIISGVRDFKSITRTGSKAAYVCVDGVDIGIGNMFKTYAEIMEYTILIEIFSNIEEARNWLLYKN